MRILLLAQFYPPIIGGEERHVRNLGAALAARGHRVTVGTLWYPGAEAQENDGEVRVRRLRGTAQRLPALFSESERRHAPPFPDPELVRGLKRLVDEVKPDVVHVHNWMVHSYLPLKKWSGIPLVMTLHDYSLVCAKKSAMRDGVPCDGPAVIKCLKCARDHYGTAVGAVTTLAVWIEQKIQRRAIDAFLAVSGAVADFNRLESGPAPYAVIPNFIPDEITKLDPLPDPRLDRLPSGDFILFVGDLNRHKGVHTLIEAHASLDAPPPLVLIGRAGPDTPTQLPPGVHLFERWPHAAIMQAWNRCLFGVAPSVWPEPCATVVMEGMSQGKTMIVTDTGGMRDIVAHGESGLVVPPGDAQTLAAAMRILLDNPSIRRRLAANAARDVEKLVASSVVSRIEQVYSDVIGRRAIAEVAVRRDLMNEH